MMVYCCLSILNITPEKMQFSKHKLPDEKNKTNQI